MYLVQNQIYYETLVFNVYFNRERIIQCQQIYGAVEEKKMKSMDSYDSRSSLIINPFVSGEDNNAR